MKGKELNKFIDYIAFYIFIIFGSAIFFYMINNHWKDKLKVDSSISNDTIKSQNGERYFLVCFEFYKKRTGERNYGNDWFACDKFPSYHDIDSIIFTFDKYSRECYGNLNIISFYEFKSESDYLRFSVGTKSDSVYNHKFKCH